MEVWAAVVYGLMLPTLVWRVAARFAKVAEVIVFAVPPA